MSAAYSTTDLPFMLQAPVVIELAGEPRGKGRPRFSRKSGVAFTPAATRSYESALRLAGQEAMNGAPPLSGALRVTVSALFPVPTSYSRKKTLACLQGIEPHIKSPDVDNLLKTIDALNEIVWRDDKQVIEAIVRKAYSERPALRIEVERV